MFFLAFLSWAVFLVTFGVTIVERDEICNVKSFIIPFLIIFFSIISGAFFTAQAVENVKEHMK